MTVQAESEVVLQLIKRLEMSADLFRPGSGVPFYLIKGKAKEEGVSGDMVSFYLDKLKEDGFVYEVFDGVYASIPRDARRPI